jgi:hypothetical protein
MSFALLALLLLCTACQNKRQQEPSSAIKTSYIYNHETFARRSEEAPLDTNFVSNHSSYYRHRYYQPVYPVKLETYEIQCIEFQNFIAQHGHYSTYKPLIGIVSEFQEDIVVVNQLLIRIQENVKNMAHMQLMADEVLAKVMAYRNLKVGQKIPVPVAISSNKSKIVMYKVDKVFNLSGGMPAFGLVPHTTAKAPPILLFRGTDLSFSLKGYSSILADLDLNGPGLSVFYRAEDELQDWLEKVSYSHSKARVLGYSLGGSFVQYACINESEFICKDERFPSVAFNQPGVSEELVLKWHRLKTEEKPSFKGYVTEGDVVSTVGKLIGDVKELTLDHLLEPLTAHVTLMSIQHRLYAYSLDVTLKNELDYSAQDPQLKKETSR